MKKILLIACLFAVSCQGTTLPSISQLDKEGKAPLEFQSMTKSPNPAVIGYELQLRNLSSDTIISFEYTMVKFTNGIFEGSEEKAFGGNYTVAPGEQFGILCRMEGDAPDIRFLIKSASWKETSSGSLFRWDNRSYEEELRKMKLD
jgi:hypothetical protein